MANTNLNGRRVELNEATADFKERKNWGEDYPFVKRFRIHASNVGQTSDENKEMFLAPYPGNANRTLTAWEAALPTVARVFNVSSTSTADAGDQTGAKTLKFVGVNENFELAEETITLSGTSESTTTGTYFRILSAEVATAGSDGGNQGDIKIVHDSKDNHLGYILSAGTNIKPDSKTSIGAAFVPKDYIGFISDITFSTDASVPAIVSIFTRKADINQTLDAGTEFPLVKQYEVVCSDSQLVDNEVDIFLEEGTEVFISKYSSSDPNNSPCYVTFTLTIAKKDYIIGPLTRQRV